MIDEPQAAQEARYPYVAVDVHADATELVGALLFELGALGIEERDELTLARPGAPGKVTVVGSFEQKEDAAEAVTALQEAFPDGGARLEEVVGDAWRDAWKEHFSPFALTPRITIVPPWLPRPALEPGRLLLELEPGRAFGTGLHATTALVAEELDGAAASLAGRALLDVGTGSGILMLVALLYGAARCVGIDVDADVVEVVEKNAERNGQGDRVTVHAGSIDQIHEAFPWVVANIEARALRGLAPDLARVLAPGGTLVLSGILESEHDEMVRLYTSLPARFQHKNTRRRRDDTGDGWVAIALTRVP
jgi:ribosomal protein L11 methyltransferase